MPKNLVHFLSAHPFEFDEYTFLIQGVDDFLNLIVNSTKPWGAWWFAIPNVIQYGSAVHADANGIASLALYGGTAQGI